MLTCHLGTRLGRGPPKRATPVSALASGRGQNRDGIRDLSRGEGSAPRCARDSGRLKARRGQGAVVRRYLRHFLADQTSADPASCKRRAALGLGRGPEGLAASMLAAHVRPSTASGLRCRPGRSDACACEYRPSHLTPVAIQPLEPPIVHRPSTTTQPSVCRQIIGAARFLTTRIWRRASAASSTRAAGSVIA